MKKQNPYKVMGIVVLVFTLISWRFDNEYIFYFAMGLGIIVYSSEKVATFLAESWMKLGKFLGGISSRILLSVFFVLFLLPIGFLKRILAKKENSKNSTWQAVSDKVDFTKPW